MNFITFYAFLITQYLCVQFYSYNIFMKMLQGVPKIEKWHHTTHFIAGAGGGSVATIISFPFDTVRTRLVAQSSNHQVYNGVLHSCRQVAENLLSIN